MATFKQRLKYAWKILLGKSPVAEHVMSQRQAAADVISTREQKVWIGYPAILLEEGEVPIRIKSIVTNVVTPLGNNPQARWVRRTDGDARELIVQFLCKLVSPDNEKVVLHGMFNGGNRNISIFTDIPLSGYAVVEVEMAKPSILRQ